MACKRKNVAHDLETKYEIVLALERGEKSADLARKHKIKPNTISDWKKIAEKIKEEYEHGHFEGHRKKLRRSKFEDIEQAVSKWFANALSENIPINGPLIMAKAEELARKLNYVNWRASAGWIDRFKKRHGIVFKHICGDNSYVRDESVPYLYRNVFHGILKYYKPQDIYNADETGVFWKCLPDRSLTFKEEIHQRVKNPKDRLTVLLATNMDGSEKLPLLVIGKSRQYLSFKNVPSLPCEYQEQCKAWITGDIYTDWVKKLDRRLQLQKRRAALIVDNCRAHPAVKGLKALTVFYLPPNTTSKTQPMNQGIIHVFKVCYRKYMVLEHLFAMENGKEYHPTILDALKHMRAAWNQVSQSLVQNCWFHSISPEVSDEHFEEQCRAAAVELLKLATDAQSVQCLEVEAATDVGMTIEDFKALVEIDESAEVYGELTDDEIISSLQKSDEADNHLEEHLEEHKSYEPAPHPCSLVEASELCQRLRNFISQSDDACYLHDNLEIIETFIKDRQLKICLETSTVSCLTKDISNT